MHREEDKAEPMCACLDQVVDLALQSIKECNYGLCVTQVAIETIFSPPLLSDPQFLVCLPGLRRFFRVLMEMGTMKRGYIIVNATARLIQVWGRRQPSPDGGSSINISALSSFADELVRLLVLSELSDSMYHRSDDEDLDLAEAGVLLKEDVEQDEAAAAAAAAAETDNEKDPEEPSLLR